MKAFEQLTPQQWNDWVNENNAVKLDVRTAGEFSDSYINGATNIDINSADFAQKVAELDRNAAYGVYCRSGMRSTKAMNMMQEMGFTCVNNLSGGIMGWEHAKFEVEYGDDF
ncbi:MAG: rhodanese-like domain-containing protein [Bacteroidetes bacterium]|nr:rhodanese-like domain-containing protein [Bacteroidota bacterium]